MPRVKIDYVVSFSSEDSENAANNLLANEVSKKKWLCSEGEPSCSVVLQLAKAVQISTVHIGACHAALVEVLVGRSEKPNDQFEVLVPSSVFLSPLESRRGSGAERVRSFSGEQLGAARERRWDRIRVVCSQPYNKHCKYGLSFIHIFEPEDKLDPQPAPAQAPAPAVPAAPARMLTLDTFSSDEDDFRPGEMFARHRTSGQGVADTGAQIRQATSQALKNISDSSTKLVKTPITKASTNRPGQSKEFDANRHKDALMYTDDDELPNTKIDKIVQRHKDDKEESKKKEQKESRKKDTPRKDKLENSSRTFKDFIDDKNDKRKDLNDSRSKDKTPSLKKIDDTNQNSHRDDKKRHGNSQDKERGGKRNDDSQDRDKESRKRDDDDRNRDRDSRKRPHSDAKPKDKAALRAGPVSSAPHTLLSGVTFALSGYENPRRARLRDAAVAMGARFERDWNASCTHLICAFPNTPKLKTVRAARSDCIAVLGEWVEQCCETRRLLPWQWFATEPKRKVSPPENYGDEASEGDTDDEIEKVLRKQKKQRIDNSPPPTNRDRSPRPQTSKDRSPKPHSSKDRSPKPHSSRNRSPKPSSSRDRSPRPHSSRNRSPKPSCSRDRSPKPSSSRDRSPKPSSSRDRSPKPHSSRERSPKPHSSRERSPQPHSSKDRSPKPSSSRDRSPKPHSSKEKTPSKKNSLDYSNASTDSDVAFVKDERIQANITINSDSDETDEEKPSVREKLDKKSVLPDFFEGYTFVIDESVEGAGFDKDLLSRYVKAYGGVVMDPSLLDSDSEVSFVLSSDATARGAGKTVRADWVWRCHEDKQLCDVAEYVL